MIYLTYNDAPSGIYSSQVIDVCNFLNTKLNAKIRLVSIISLRGFGANRKKIKAEMPDAIVLPMFPGVHNWSLNVFRLFFLFMTLGRQSVIARGPFAASMAIKLKKMKVVRQVCFDGRGAYDAEFNEYDVAGNPQLNKEIFALEKNAVLNADFRIAISRKLVSYWSAKFGYAGNTHVVIPCTVSSQLFNTLIDENRISVQKAALGFSDEDVVLVYSGSSAGWQSLKLADEFLVVQMRNNPRIKALFLTDKLPDNMKVMEEFLNRVSVRWLQNDQVPGFLRCCDYGLLLREGSVTNSVSSPVKFAEYLAAGLRVIISEGIGDYPEFIKEHKLGMVIGPVQEKFVLEKVSGEGKKGITTIATKYFTKDSHTSEYAKVLSVLK